MREAFFAIVATCYVFAMVLSVLLLIFGRKYEFCCVGVMAVLAAVLIILVAG